MEMNNHRPEEVTEMSTKWKIVFRGIWECYDTDGRDDRPVFTATRVEPWDETSAPTGHWFLVNERTRSAEVYESLSQAKQAAAFLLADEEG